MTNGDQEAVDFWKEHLALIKTTMRDADKLKKVMLKRGLHAAKAKCPECEGYLVAVLLGRKNHIHMHCTGSCKRKMME